MRLKLVLAITVLLAVSANRPCFAKDGHAQHGARASATNTSAGGRGAIGANSAPSKANVPSDAEATVAPSEVPPHGAAQQGNRNANLKLKIVPPGNRPHNVPAGAATTMPTARNAIGQPVVPPKNFAGAHSPLPALLRPGAVSPPIVHGGPAVSPAVSSGTARVNVANGTNRSNLNGATVIRPTTRPPVIGGPAQARYGINGTTVQNKH